MHFSDDMYTEINTKPKKYNRIRYDPILYFLCISYILLTIGFTVYLAIIISPYLKMIGEILDSIPGEIQFYHESFAMIENKINQLLSNHTIQNIDQTILNINRISAEMNVTQIQSDLSQIVVLLEHVIK